VLSKRTFVIVEEARLVVVAEREWMASVPVPDIAPAVWLSVSVQTL